MMQRAYSCVTLHVKHKTLPFVAVLTWFLILSKIQNGDQDGDHCWWRHRPPAAPLPLEYTSYCWEDRRRSTKGKIASKYCNISKTLGRGSTWKRTQQLPTFMAQRFWELLRLFACSLQQWVSFHHSSFWERLSMSNRKCGFKKVVDILRFGLRATSNSDDESYIFQTFIKRSSVW